MIKSINQLITQRCNSKCNMCLVWKRKEHSFEMNASEYYSLYATPGLCSTLELTLSGGEPTLRKDLPEIFNAIVFAAPNIDTVFLSTNCSFPQRIFRFVEEAKRHVSDVYIVVALDGDYKTHRAIRGVNSYDKVLSVLAGVKALDDDHIHAIISTTIQQLNCEESILRSIEETANKYNTAHTFRPVAKSAILYENTDVKNILLNPIQIELLIRMVSQRINFDPFMDQLFKYLSGKRTIMEDANGNLRCLAGHISAFITANGSIYPCIYSDNIIGNKQMGLFENYYYHSVPSGCPCCTECQIYPMLNFADNTNEKE